MKWISRLLIKRIHGPYSKQKSVDYRDRMTEQLFSCLVAISLSATSAVTTDEIALHLQVPLNTN